MRGRKISDKGPRAVPSVLRWALGAASAAVASLSLAEPVNPAVGARRTLAVLYQNCGALQRRPWNSSENLEGIGRDTRRHPHGTYFRTITDSRAFLASHPYLPSAPALSAAGCFDVRRSPPVYDYGGTPFDLSPDPEHPLVSLHRNAGTGSPDMLGIDCSGLVATAHFAAGLKLSRRPLDLSAQQFDDFDSRQFATAPAGVQGKPNGRMDCLGAPPIRASTELAAGDVIAWPGHVVMIDSVGEDPLGIGRASSARDCARKIAPENFDFVIIQSSASDTGIGANRMRGADYFVNVAQSVGVGLKKIAVEICKERHGEARTRGSLGETRLKNDEGGVSLAWVRHVEFQGESDPACRMPAVHFEHEACVAACMN